MTRLAIILTEGFADWECAHLMGAGRSYFGFEILVATPEAKPVRSAGGLLVTPDTETAQLRTETLDGLVLCGGAIWESAEAPELSDILQSVHAEGKLVAGICGATLALARAGLLDSVPHTSNAADFLAQVPRYRGAAHYRDTPAAVRTENLVTAPGTAPVTFMAETFEALGYGGDELDSYLGMLGAEHEARHLRASVDSI